MESQTENVTPILEVAWRKFAQYDDTAVQRTASFTNLRRWILNFGVLATLLSILTTIYPDEFPRMGLFVLKILLVASPIVASVLAAIGNEYFSTGDWLVARAGAEEILRDMYLYRTILKGNPKRREWLERRLARVQRSVYRGMNGELVMKTFKGNLPPKPRFNPGEPGNDTGFNDLGGDEYFKYRLESELGWHEKKVVVKQRERFRLQVMIYVSGALGAIIAAIATFGESVSSIAIWVALTASLTSAFSVWQQLKNLEQVVRNYSKVVLELGIISDHWKNLEAGERTQSEVNRMVQSAENILWSRNVEYIKAMQEALRDSSLDKEAELINNVVAEQREADARFKQALTDSIVDKTSEELDKVTADLGERFDEILGTLAEEASSEVVQAELAAMREAIQDFAENMAHKIGLSHRLEAIKEDYKDVDVGSETPRGVLNDLLSRFPKTEEVKG